MVLREIFAKLGLKVDESGFKKGDKKIADLAGGFGGMIAGAMGAAAAIAAFVSVVKEGGELKDMSARTGVSTDALQGLKYAAQQTGADLGAVMVGMKTLAGAAYEASQGSEEAQKTFKALGVTYQDGNGHLKDNETLLADVGQALSRVEDPTKRLALARKALGKSGEALLPMLTDENRSLAEYMQRSRELGQLTADQVDELDDFGDATDDLVKALRGGLYAIVVKLVQKMKPWVDWLTEVAISMRKTYDGSQTVQGAIAALGYVLAGFGLLLVAVAVKAAAAWVVAMWPFIVIGALLGGLLLLVEDIWAFFTDPNADSMTGRLVKGLKELWGTLVEDPKRVFVEFFAWLLSGFGKTAEEMGRTFGEALIGTFEEIKRSFNPEHQKMLAQADYDSKAGNRQELAEMFSWLPGVNAGPSKSAPTLPASAIPAPAGMSQANTLKPTFNIYATPNQSPFDIANESHDLWAAKNAVPK